MRAIQRNTVSRNGDSLSPESDSSLVRLAKQDIRSFAPLYERYRDYVLRYCVHCLGNWEDAADATQQTFTNVLAGPSQSSRTRTIQFPQLALSALPTTKLSTVIGQRTRRPEHPLDRDGLG